MKLIQAGLYIWLSSRRYNVYLSQLIRSERGTAYV